MNTIDRDALASERDFLLRSLDDLEVERAAGNIDDGTYRTLHDDYTARAAAVIRTLEDGIERTPPPRPAGPVWMRAATIGALVVFGIVGAFYLARAVGERQPGDTITGRTSGATPTTDLRATGDALAAVVEANPDSYDARIAHARFLMQTQELADAVKEFDVAATIDPTQPEPLAYGGWIRALAAQQVTDDDDHDLLLTQALALYDRAITADANYADAYVFRGLTYMNVADDPEDAVPALQQFLVLAPSDHPMRAAVLETLARAVESTSTTQP